MEFGVWRGEWQKEGRQRVLSAFGVMVMDCLLLAGGEDEGSGFRRGGVVDIALTGLEGGE